MSETEGLPRPTQAAWAIYDTAGGGQVRVPRYVPSAATNMLAIQTDDVPKGAVYLRDEPLDVAVAPAAPTEAIADLDRRLRAIEAEPKASLLLSRIEAVETKEAAIEIRR